MNREILFRGKRTDNDEWVNGWLIKDEYGMCIASNDALYHVDGNEWNFEDVEVNPETVGQYTGLTDKNGTKIFEGDIISVEFELDREPEYGECPKWYENYVVTFDEVHHCWGTKITSTEIGEWLYEYDDNCATVIGSIFDNPELLEEKA